MDSTWQASLPIPAVVPWCQQGDALAHGANQQC